MRPATSTQPEKLVKIISEELGITDYSTIVNWELELFDTSSSNIPTIFTVPVDVLSEEAMSASCAA
jgi:phosphohistidine swiveling domain-containing protein